MYAEMAEHTKRGDLWNFIWQNVTLGQKASLLWAVGAGRYVQTCGLFMLGMLIGRRKLFISSEENSRFWIKTLIITAIAFGPLYQLKVLLMDTADSAIVRQTAGSSLICGRNSLSRLYWSPLSCYCTNGRALGVSLPSCARMGR